MNATYAPSAPMNAAEIERYMTTRGWGFGESRVLNQIVVSFSRSDWHGRRLDYPLVVCRYGHPDYRDRLIREAGREALHIWKEFRGTAPAQYFDSRRRRIVWDVRPAVA